MKTIRARLVRDVLKLLTVWRCAAQKCQIAVAQHPINHEARASVCRHALCNDQFRIFSQLRILGELPMSGVWITSGDVVPRHGTHHVTAPEERTARASSGSAPAPPHLGARNHTWLVDELQLNLPVDRALGA